MSSLGRAWLAGAVIAAAVGFTAACTAAPSAAPARLAGATAQAAPPTGPVVALGDSYTAGGLLPLQSHARPAGCLRSAKAYPVLVARSLGAPLVDASCAGAGVKNMAAAQPVYLGGTNPPQLSALAPDDRLVLLTLSGDDLGFLNVLRKCMKLSFSQPWGSPCADYYTSGGTDQFAKILRAEGPKMAGVLAGIAARAPRARIVVVGYPDLFPRDGCWPSVPITSGDIGYLRATELNINAMLAARAKAAGALFVNTFAPTTGHDFCQPESVRDVEGVLPGSLALPFHPNARGQSVIARSVLAALKA